MTTRILLLGVAAVLLAASVWLGLATAGTGGELHHSKPAYGGWGECDRTIPRPDVLPAQHSSACGPTPH